MKGFDRVLWEAMRPELLKKKVARPEEFVEGIEDLVVCHCDQIPMWLRLGATKQLYTKTEVQSKKRKLHEAKKRGEVQAAGNEEGGPGDGGGSGRWHGAVEAAWGWGS